MKIQLEFLDVTGAPLHEDPIEFQGWAPLPAIGDLVTLGTSSDLNLRVLHRSFRFEVASPIGPVTKIALRCERATTPRSPETRLPAGA